MLLLVHSVKNEKKNQKRVKKLHLHYSVVFPPIVAFFPRIFSHTDSLSLTLKLFFQKFNGKKIN